MRKDVEFKTQDGVTLRGWHYLPDQRSGKVPMYCSPVLRHSAGLIQAANFRSAVVF